MTAGGPSPGLEVGAHPASPGSWAPGSMRWPQGQKRPLPALLTRSALLGAHSPPLEVGAQLEAASPHQGCKRRCIPGCQGSGRLWTTAALLLGRDLGQVPARGDTGGRKSLPPNLLPKGEERVIASTPHPTPSRRDLRSTSSPTRGTEEGPHPRGQTCPPGALCGVTAWSDRGPEQAPARGTSATLMAR